MRYGVRQESDVLDLFIYDYVEGDSYDWWTGQKIESETSANFIMQKLSEHENVSQINVYINSYGGSVKEGLAIYNQLLRHKANKHVYIDGYACSIASVIAMCGDTITMAKNALMMIHNASMGVFGTSEELRKSADDLDVINRASCSTYLDRAGDKLTEENLKEMLDKETWLNAEQCIAFGLADDVLQKKSAGTDNVEQAYHEYVEQARQAQKRFSGQAPQNPTNGKNPFGSFFSSVE
ncbi:MAG: Clp protease ClpP [Clostridia bacterium]|nr:Clp protease ClpP [Clostridia bacterium]